MFLLNGEMDYKCCCFALGESSESGVKFSIPETLGIKVGGRGWLPYLPVMMMADKGNRTLQTQDVLDLGHSEPKMQVRSVDILYPGQK